MVIEHEVSQTLFSKWWRTNLIGSDTQHDTVYDGESSYGYDAYGYQYDDEPAHVGGDIDTHPTFEEGSAPSYTMYLQAPASSDVVHAAAQVLAPAPREREVDPQARVPEVVTAASPWMDHLPYQPRYTMNSASKDIAVISFLPRWSWYAILYDSLSRDCCRLRWSHLILVVGVDELGTCCVFLWVVPGSWGLYDDLPRLLGSISVAQCAKV